MHDTTQLLDRWHDFYLLIGTAAATLMGLTFVAVSLAPKVIAERTGTVVRAFTTPIVGFFATVLIVSVALLVPYERGIAAGAVFCVVGLAGFIYMLNTGVHRQWKDLQLGLDDWIWYLGLPLIAYCALLSTAVGMWTGSSWAPYGAAGSLSLLLIVGIRNAWDVVLAIARESTH